MFDLMECSEHNDRMRSYNLGAVMNAATANPDELKKLLHPPAPQVEATGMLKIPRKKPKSNG